MKKIAFSALLKNAHEKWKTNRNNDSITGYDEPFRELSQRELEVAVCIAIGAMPADVAHVLGIATKTFSTYRSRVLEKLQLHSTAELSIMAYELGYVPSVLHRWREAHEYLARDGAGDSEEIGREFGLLSRSTDAAE